MSQFILALAAVLSLSSVSFAGDASTAAQIGFSQDGKFFSYMEYGVADGSGFPYAMVKFIELEKNAFASPQVSVTNEDDQVGGIESLRAVRKKALLEARPSLAKLQISKAYFGEVLASRKLTDLSAASVSKIKFARFPVIRGLISPTYELNLVTKPATHSAKCYFNEKAVMLNLTLKNTATAKSITLQNDSTLPLSRGCVTGYRIQEVIAQENDDRRVVVLLNVLTTGFEGDDSRTMAISGMLP